MFRDPLHRDWIGVAMGAFDTPAATDLDMDIFVADQGDYHAITDAPPQKA